MIWFDLLEKIITLMTNNWISFTISIIVIVGIAAFLVWKAMQMDEQVYSFLAYTAIILIVFLILVMFDRGTAHVPAINLRNISLPRI